MSDYHRWERGQLGAARNPLASSRSGSLRRSFPRAPPPPQPPPADAASAAHDASAVPPPEIPQHTPPAELPPPVPVFMPVGLRRGPDLKFTDRNSGDFFTALDAFLKQHRVKLAELFHAADADKSGSLDRAELSRLVEHIMPAAAAEQAYFQRQLDACRVERMRFDDFVAFLRATMAAGAAAPRPGLSAEMTEVILRVRDAEVRAPGSLRARFEQRDPRRVGALEGPDISEFLFHSAHNMSTGDVRNLLAYLHVRDVGKLGRLTFDEMREAVGLDQPQLVQGEPQRNPAHGAHAHAAAPAHATQPQPPPGAWVLHPFDYSGRRLLEDRATGIVYQEVGRAGGQLCAVGARSRRSSGGVDFVDRQRGDFFNHFDAFLQQRQVRLADVFAQADRDQSGSLDMEEVAGVVLGVMPYAAGWPEAAYFRRQLYAAQARSMRFDDFKAFLTAALTAGRAAAAGDSGANAMLGGAIHRIRKTAERSPGLIEAAFRDALEQARQQGRPEDAPAAAQGLLASFAYVDFLYRCLPAGGERDSGPAAQQAAVRFLLAWLHAQDVYLTGTLTLEQFSHAMGLVQPFVADPNAAGMQQQQQQPHAGGGAAGWVLHALPPPQQGLFEDPRTGCVFDEPISGLFRPVGTRSPPLSRTDIRFLARDQQDFFAHFDAFLQQRQVRLPEVFRQADRDNSGSLDMDELTRVVEGVMPAQGPSGAHEASYFRRQLYAARLPSMTLEAFKFFLQAVLSAGRAAASADVNGPAMVAVGRVREAVLNSSPGALDALFARYDPSGSGAPLRDHAYVDFVFEAVAANARDAAAAAEDVRLLLAYLHARDVFFTGALSLEQFKQALGLVSPAIVPAGGAVTAGPAPPGAERQPRADPHVWVLHEYPWGSDLVLEDPATGVLYSRDPEMLQGQAVVPAHEVQPSPYHDTAAAAAAAGADDEGGAVGRHRLRVEWEDEQAGPPRLRVAILYGPNKSYRQADMEVFLDDPIEQARTRGYGHGYIPREETRSHNQSPGIVHLAALCGLLFPSQTQTHSLP